jgi:hypothetical protein
MMRRHLIPVMLVVACAKTPMSLKDAGEAAVADAADTRPTIVIQWPDARADLVAVDGPPCPTFPDACGPSGCDFPVEWASARNPSSWCGIFGMPRPEWRASLCTNADGYSQVNLARWRGGEMPLIELLVQYLYDPITGHFVQERRAFQVMSEAEPTTCAMTLPGGPAEVATRCVADHAAFQAVCSAGADAGDGSQ